VVNGSKLANTNTYNSLRPAPFRGAKGLRRERRDFLVVITDSSDPSIEPERRVLGAVGAEVRRFQCRTEEDVVRVGAEADGLLVEFAKITKRVIDGLNRVKVISRYGVGVDNVDVRAATRRGIYVANTPYDLENVADHSVMLILALARKLPRALWMTRQGRWEWNSLRPLPGLAELSVGIVGLGNVGRKVALRLRAFGCNLLGYDPYVSRSAFKKIGIKRVGLQTLLRRSDLISLHVPLTPETRHLIGERQLRLMKPTAYLVNVSRGSVVDERALYRALKGKVIAGAALDVLEKEPPTADNPLLQLDNVLVTPHMAWFSDQVRLQIQTRAAENVAAVLKGDRPAHLVNPQVVEVLLERERELS